MTEWRNKWLDGTTIERVGSIRRSTVAGRSELYYCPNCGALFWPEITPDGLYPSRYMPDSEAETSIDCECALLSTFYPDPAYHGEPVSRWAGIATIFEDEDGCSE